MTGVVLAAWLALPAPVELSEDARPGRLGERIIFVVDARIELHALLLALARGKAPAEAGEYGREAWKRFQAFARHPAAARAQALGGAAGLGALLGNASTPAGEAYAAAARDFVAASRFAEFFETQRPFYRELVARAAEESRAQISPEAAAAYLRAPLAGRYFFALSPLWPAAEDADVPIPGGHLWVRAPGRGFAGLERCVAYALVRLELAAASAPLREELSRAVLLRVLTLDLGEKVAEETHRHLQQRGLSRVDSLLKLLLIREKGGYPRMRLAASLPNPEKTLAAAVPAPAPVPTLAPPTSVAARHKEQGVALFLKGDYAGAARLLRRAVQHDPHDAEALLSLGVVEQRLGNARAALSAYNRAVAEAMRDADSGRLELPRAALSARAGLLDSLGRTAEAAADRRRAGELEAR